MKKNFLLKSCKYILGIFFIATIFYPLITSVYQEPKKVSSLEKRNLTAFPSIKSTKDLQDFPKKFDSYYSDHFGLRDFFIKYYRLAKFKLGDSPSKDVTIGKNGWLFLGGIKKGYNRYSDPIGDAVNSNLYSKKQLKQFAEYMQLLNDWLLSQNIRYIFVIAPNKHTIYFDQLPSFIKKRGEESATDQLFNYLKKHTNIKYVDLRPSLLKEKQKYQLYYKTDTHWNHFAANIAQYEIMKEIKTLFPNKINPEKQRISSKKTQGGDLATFIGGLNAYFSDIQPFPVFNKGCKPVMIPEKVKFFTETHSFECKDEQLAAVIFRDSFFTALKPYFARKFKRSTFIWKRPEFADFVKFIDKEHPDIIIEEWVERTLPFVPSSPELQVWGQKERSTPPQ